MAFQAIIVGLPSPVFFNANANGQMITAGGAFVNAATGNNYSVSLSEAGTAVDTYSARGSFGATISETASATDILTTTGSFGAALVEAASASDNINLGSLVYGEALLEAAAAADSLAIVSPFSDDIFEIAAAQDHLTIARFHRVWNLSFARVVPSPFGEGPGNPGVLFGEYLDEEY